MRIVKVLLLVYVTCLAVRAWGEEPVRHRFVCVDNGKNLLILVDQFHPERSWATPIPSGSRDLQLLGAKGQSPAKVLVSHGNGAAEYDLASGKRLDWAVDRYREIQTAVRLGDGQTLLGRVDGTVYRLDPQGKELGQCAPATKMAIRLMRPLPDGNLLMSGAGPRALIELDRQGKVLHQVPLPGNSKGYKAIRLDRGTYLTSTGDDCKIVEIDRDGKVLSFVGGKSEHPQLGLDFCSGWDLAPNGNRMMANWLGHGKQGKGVHLAEFTVENRLVWQWQDHQLARQITNVLLIE